jgi:hypothetical protein
MPLSASARRKNSGSCAPCSGRPLRSSVGSQQ